MDGLHPFKLLTLTRKEFSQRRKDLRYRQFINQFKD